MGDPLGRIEFGGPDLEPRRLRNLLQAQVDASPRGSRIDWATYYFRDRALASALIRASDRGVRVRLAIEPGPRRAGANDAVIALLKEHGLNGGLHLYCAGKRRGERMRLHAKIYAFSDPDIAWVGSFNPSGDEPEDPEVIAEIGDQDRGHNLLLGIERPGLTAALRRYIDRLIDPPKLPLWLQASSYLRVGDGDTSLYFYPRVATIAVEPRIALLGLEGNLRGAISHLKKSPFSVAMQCAARLGARIDLLVHDTERRVPSKLLTSLAESGIRIRRISHPDGLPMHAKFLLVECGGRQTAWLGSYNFNKKSRVQNAELLIRTRDRGVFEALSKRFATITAMASGEGG